MLAQDIADTIEYNDTNDTKCVITLPIPWHTYPTLTHITQSVTGSCLPDTAIVTADLPLYWDGSWAAIYVATLGGMGTGGSSCRVGRGLFDCNQFSRNRYQYAWHTQARMAHASRLGQNVLNCCLQLIFTPTDQIVYNWKNYLKKTFDAGTILLRSRQFIFKRPKISITKF